LINHKFFRVFKQILYISMSMIISIICIKNKTTIQACSWEEINEINDKTLVFSRRISKEIKNNSIHSRI
jgi:hypothetical protein